MFTDKLPTETRGILNSIPALIDRTFPLPGRFRSALPSNVAELSRLLTGARGERSLSYLSRPNFLSAYLRYFLPWNLYRLCRLLPSLDIPLRAGDTIIDLGSGPLTLVSALWITRPQLRDIPLEFYCVDRCGPALEAGKKFFAAISTAAPAVGSNLWKINLAREDIDFRTQAKSRVGADAALVCAVNLFNEVYENLPHNNSEALRRMAANIARYTHSQAAADASILTVEPGIPQSGCFINFLRSAFMELGRPPVSPCPHSETCPLPGAKKRWCHFAFETGEAPKDLLRLSAAAGIPKERLVLSFLLAGPAAKTIMENEREVRVVSDAFPLPNNRFGRYGCSAAGLVLLTGEKNRIEKIISGSLIPESSTINMEARDEKSGALLMEVK